MTTKLLYSVVLSILVTLTMSVTNDCYNQKCPGEQAFENVTILCDQSTNHCSVNKTGYPSCDATGSGDGANCTIPADLDEFYCSINVTTGAAGCEFPPKRDCYNSKCAGQQDFNETVVNCDQSSNHCAINATGFPSCVNTTRGNGLNCIIPADLDEFYCSNDVTTGAAGCEFPPKRDCYNSKCVGQQDFNETVINCDQSSNHCAINATGFPSCVNTTRGNGLNCTIPADLDEFYCSNNGTGAAVCEFPPKRDCYDSKCAGQQDFNETVVNCDQSSNHCAISATGFPSCVNTTRGNGRNCTTTVDLDEFYCSNAKSNGSAFCVYPPQHDCYNTKCSGNLTFTATYIECNQTSHRCGYNSTGYPVCIDGTRGAGLSCKSNKFTCKNNKENGLAACKVSAHLTALWVVMGLVAVLILCVVVFLVIRKIRGRAAEDRTSLVAGEII